MIPPNIDLDRFCSGTGLAFAVKRRIHANSIPPNWLDYVVRHRICFYREVEDCSIRSV